MTESWLITGGVGFIGSNFVRLSAQRKRERLIILDALTYAGNLENIGDLLDPSRVIFIKGDICDHLLVSRIFQEYKIDKVIHFAAESHVDRSILGPSPFIKTNIEGTYNLLECARSSWKERTGPLFLHVSTDEVFGMLGSHDSPFTEDSVYKPRSPYSASKASADHLVLAWHHTFGLPVVITNCSNNYGPRQFPEKLIPLTILNSLEDKPIPVYGDGLQVRDWIHVEDHCRALFQVIEKGKRGETYLIGSHSERNNLEVINQICDLVDEILNRAQGSSRKLITPVKDRPAHDRRYAINSQKIRKELGWKPVFSFEEGLRDVVRWYSENRSWADRVRSGDYRRYYETQYGEK